MDAEEAGRWTFTESRMEALGSEKRTLVATLMTEMTVSCLTELLQITLELMDVAKLAWDSATQLSESSTKKNASAHHDTNAPILKSLCGYNTVQFQLQAARMEREEAIRWIHTLKKWYSI